MFLGSVGLLEICRVSLGRAVVGGNVETTNYCTSYHQQELPLIAMACLNL